MSSKLRNGPRISAAASLALTLAACGHKDTTQASAPTQPGNLGLMTSVSDSGAPLDWAAQDSAPPSLPVCAPMVQQASTAYRPAPSFGYRRERVYYDEAPPSGDDYSYLALAGALTGVIGDAPPDYAFDYDGVEPWVWETGDHYVTYAEPIDSGYRYYFYAPGAAVPFLIRDPSYSYGYRNGGLAAIYDREGRRLDFARAAMQRAAAAQYWNRAAALRQAYGHSPRLGVPANIWAERRGYIARDRNQWIAARRQQDAWRGWDAQHAPAMQARWSAEAAARRYAANRFDRWHAEGYRSGSPRFYDEARQDPRVQLATQRERVLDHQFAAQRMAQPRGPAATPQFAQRPAVVAQQRPIDDRRQALFASQQQQQRATMAMQQQQQRQFTADRQRVAARSAFELQADRRQASQRVALQQRALQQRAVQQRGDDRRQAMFSQRRAVEAQAGVRRAALMRARGLDRAQAMRGQQLQARAAQARERSAVARTQGMRAQWMRSQDTRERQAMMMRGNRMERREPMRQPPMRANMMAQRQAAMRQNFAEHRAPQQPRGGFEPRQHGGGEQRGGGRVAMQERQGH